MTSSLTALPPASPPPCPREGGSGEPWALLEAVAVSAELLSSWAAGDTERGLCLWAEGTSSAAFQLTT